MTDSTISKQERAEEDQQRTASYLERLLNDLEKCQQQGSLPSWRLPSVDTLIDRWGDRVIGCLPNLSEKETDFYSDYNHLLRSFAKLSLESAFQYALSRLGYLSVEQHQAIYVPGSWTSNSRLDFTNLFSLINHIFSNASSVEQSHLGTENLERIPLNSNINHEGILSPKNIFLLPTQDYEFYSLLIDNLSHYLFAEEEVTNSLKGCHVPTHLKRCSIDFEKFNHYILRKEGAQAEQQRKIFEPVLKLSYDDNEKHLEKTLFYLIKDYSSFNQNKMESITAMSQKIQSNNKDLNSFFHFCSLAVQISLEKFQAYITAATKTLNPHGQLDSRFFSMFPEDTLEKFCPVYDAISFAVLNRPESLYIEEEIVKPLIIKTKRWHEIKKGIKDRLEREQDALLYLFEEMYHVFSIPSLRWDSSAKKVSGRLVNLKAQEDGEYLKEILLKNMDKKKLEKMQVQNIDFSRLFQPPSLDETIQHTLDHWTSVQGDYVDKKIQQGLQSFNFTQFFLDHEVQQLVKQKKEKGYNGKFLFSSLQEIIFSKLHHPQYYLNPIACEEMEDALDRMKKGLELTFNFDEFRVEYNSNVLNDFFTNVGDCLSSQNERYRQYGLAHMQDKNIGIIAANLYKEGTHQATVGKAFLARCHDKDKKKVLYVDGIILNQDVADILKEPNKENNWMAMYTKAVIETAIAKSLKEIFFNTYHTDVQRSAWQYIKHIAELLEIAPGEYTYRENSNTLATNNEFGFRLSTPDKRDAQGNCLYIHQLEKIYDDSYSGDHFLAGFFINHWINTQDTKKKEYSKVPEIEPLQGRAHHYPPYINRGEGYIIGFRIKTDALINLFNRKYGSEYGLIQI